MKAVVRHFEAYVRSSGFAPYNSVSQQGNWKQLTVRGSANSDDLMLWAILSPQGLTEEDKGGIREGLKAHFGKEDCEVKVTSLHVQFFERKQKGGKM